MWYKIIIPFQHIKKDCGHSLLIKMPKKSRYPNFCFWYPNRFMYDSPVKCHYNMGFSDQFTFVLKRYGARSLKILEEKTITAQELYEIFTGIKENLETAPKVKDYHIQEPTKLGEIEVVIPHDLKN